MKQNKNNRFGEICESSVSSWLSSYMLFLIMICFTTNVMAQDLNQQRAEAVDELKSLFYEKFISVEANLTKSEGPERWENFFAKPILGCPEDALFNAEENFQLEFTTSKGGDWAGSLDGINVKTNRLTGFSGGSLATPSQSIEEGDFEAKGPELWFFFNETDNVQRAAIDEITSQMIECHQNLPVGYYTKDEMSKLCPRPKLPSNRKQNCAVNTTGTIGEMLSGGSGYNVIVQQNTMCDGVGYGKVDPQNTGWISCYNNTYEGVAKITEVEAVEVQAQLEQLRKASRKILARCSKRASRNKAKTVRSKARSVRKARNCASKRMARRVAKLN